MKDTTHDHYLMDKLYSYVLKKEWKKAFVFMKENPECILHSVSYLPEDRKEPLTVLKYAILEEDKSVLPQFAALYKPYGMGVFTRDTMVIRYLFHTKELSHIEWLLNNSVIEIDFESEFGSCLLNMIEARFPNREIAIEITDQHYKFLLKPPLESSIDEPNTDSKAIQPLRESKTSKPGSALTLSELLSQEPKKKPLPELTITKPLCFIQSAFHIQPSPIHNPWIKPSFNHPFADPSVYGKQLAQCYESNKTLLLNCLNECTFRKLSATTSKTTQDEPSIDDILSNLILEEDDEELRVENNNLGKEYKLW